MIFPNNDSNLNTVIGTPIVLPTLANPSLDEIDFYHNKLIEEEIKLFEKYKQ